MNEGLNTSYSTLFLIALKEIRLDRNIPQGIIAASAGKSPNAWSKIEAGQSPLPFDSLFGASYGINVHPQQMIMVIEILSYKFRERGVCIHTQTLTTEEDDILNLSSSYFNSPGHANMKNYSVNAIRPISVSALLFLQNSNVVPTVVTYCTDPTFRSCIDKGALLEIPTAPVLPFDY